MKEEVRTPGHEGWSAFGTQPVSQRLCLDAVTPRRGCRTRSGGHAGQIKSAEGKHANARARRARANGTFCYEGG
jgi:hypothetical protein